MVNPTKHKLALVLPHICLTFRIVFESIDECMAVNVKPQTLIAGFILLHAFIFSK